MNPLSNSTAAADDAFAWTHLLDSIADGQVVPVLGHELLEAEYAGVRTTLQSLVAEQYARKKGLKFEARRHFELADAVAAFVEQPGVRPDDAYTDVNNVVTNLQPPFPIPESLRQLAAIRDFELFVSTTPDDLMAAALDEVRKPVTRRLAFSIKQSTKAHAEAKHEPPQGVPVVFNLFGRFCTLPEYALHEEDILEFIHGLVSREPPPPDWLMSRLRDHDLLLLGVHLPDWLERLVLRSANTERLCKADRVYYVARETEPSAAALALFFQRFGRDSRLNLHRGASTAFVAELYRRWTARQPADAGDDAASPATAASARRGSIFISYDRQNLPAVERLYAALDKSSDHDVWFDQRDLQPGSTWEREIASQIRHGVKLFIPVLSDLTERKPNSEGIVFAEWRAAVDRARTIKAPRTFIVPVVIDDDLITPIPARYPTLMRTFPEFEDYTFGLAPAGVPNDALLAAVRDQLKLIRSATALA